MTYHEILAMCKRSDCLSFMAQRGVLSLITDDFPRDRRTCVEVRLHTGSFDVKTLRGWDARRSRWSEYCAPSSAGNVESKRGLKALKEWLRGRCMDACGYPNPPMLNLYNLRHEN